MEENLTGQRIGEYEIGRRLGVGGMGVVYEGLQPVIGKRVAVKVLLPQFSKEPDLVARFLSEARAVNAIRHRGIIDIFSFGELPSGSHYFVMELLDGEPFDHIIDERAPVEPSLALTWMAEVLDALDAAHEQGIIHRDIKPSNIFLVNGPKGRSYVKLLDFGIAKLGAQQQGSDGAPLTRASVVIGTPDYMSPEQARAKPISPATDLYALGCVFFELVTGRRPYQCESPIETMFAHVAQPIPHAAASNLALPAELDALIYSMMEKDPAKRPASAEVCRERALELLTLLGPPTPSAPRPSRAGETIRDRVTPLPPPTPGPQSLSPTADIRLPRSATPMPVDLEPTHVRPRPTKVERSTKPVTVPPEPAPPDAARSTSPVTVPPQAGVDRSTKPVTVPPQANAAPVDFDPNATSRAPVVDTAPPVATPQEVETPRASGSRRAPLIVGGLLALALAVGLIAFRQSAGPSQPVAPTPPVAVPQPTPEQQVKPVEPPTPVAVPPTPPIEATPPPTPVVDAPTPVVDAGPVGKSPVRPVNTGPTAERLTQRFGTLTKKAIEREKAGAPDPIVKGLLLEAQKQINTADTPGKRSEAMKLLNEIDQLLKAAP